MAIETVYVAKRKRRLAAKLVAMITSITLVTFVIIAYLGSTVGRYTISLEQDRIQMTMSQDNGFSRPTTLLRATNLTKAYPISVDSLPSHEVLDAGEGSHNGVRLDEYGKFVSDIYFAYTFYVKNLSDLPVDYGVHLKLKTSASTVTDAVPVADYVRIRFYENRVNEGNQTHNYSTYAKRTNLVVYDENEQPEYRECISITNPDKTCSAGFVENIGRASEFYSLDSIAKYTHYGLPSQEVVRYTIVIWLEGNDPDCFGVTPQGASMEFSMNILSLQGETPSSISVSE